MTQTPHTLNEWEALYPPRQLPAGAEVVRIAPSPTGKPHIGTAFQAIVNYGMARGSNGVFVLRIEDTDRKRLVPGAVEEILDSLNWLQVPPDEGPGHGGDYGSYIESERLESFKLVADRLVAEGKAYPCYCTPERLTALREGQLAAGEPPRYDRHCRNLSPDQRAAAAAQASAPPVVRLAMPDSGMIGFDDLIRDHIEFSAAEQDDPVLLKSDGYPTYHLASTVDDHFMRITTVVRGEEWISSAPKHIVLYAALGWEVPRMLHTPLLRDASRRKLGKRSGDTSIGYYRAQGYLPEAFRNFITRIIWTHPEGKDVYPYDDFIRLFKGEALTKSGPVVDPALLDHISCEHIRHLGAAPLYERTAEWLAWVLARTEESVEFEVVEKSGRTLTPFAKGELQRFADAFTASREFSEGVLSLEPERYKKLSDIFMHARLFYATLFSPAERDLLAKQAKGDAALAVALLEEYLPLHDQSGDEQQWQRIGYGLAERRELKPGVVFMLLRVAITGLERTPPLFSIMRVIGADEVRRRIGLALGALRES